VRTLVITPTYAEGENIEEFLRRTRAAVPDADILVVDDNSPDGTAAIAARVAGELGHIEILHRERKEGLGTAYRAGFAYGIAQGYERLCEIDADLSHDPGVLPDLMRRADETDADLVIGSRLVPGGSIPNWPWHRREISRIGNLYAGLALGIKVRDATSGYRVFRASTLQTIDYSSTRANGYAFQIETAYRILKRGGTVVEAPITFVDREHGYSKFTLSVAAEALVLVTLWGIRDRVRAALGWWRSRRSRP
jgi:dolichol-phosphate mannosyltransferase